MKKIICLVTLSIVIVTSVFAQGNGPLRGKYNETSSTVQVGNEQLRFWLYRLPSHITFDAIVVELCEYLENRYPEPYGNPGWPIYWDGVQEWNPNPDLAPSVITMMRRLNRNVSVHIIQNTSSNYPPEGMYINFYDSIRDSYSTLFFPCYR